MFEKHCFISPVVYKEMAQIEVMVPVYGLSSISQTFNFSHTERVAESWERKTSVTLCWKIEFWFEKKRRKSKENVKTLFLIEVKQKLFFFSKRASYHCTFLSCGRFQVYITLLHKEQTLETHIPSTWTTCGFWLAPSKCFSFPLDFEQES